MSKLEEIKVLKDTIKYFNSQIEPHDCGWMYTTIDGLQHYIKQLKRKKKRKSKRFHGGGGLSNTRIPREFVE